MCRKNLGWTHLFWESYIVFESESAHEVWAGLGAHEGEVCAPLAVLRNALRGGQNVVRGCSRGFVCCVAGARKAFAGRTRTEPHLSHRVEATGGRARRETEGTPRC